MSNRLVTYMHRRTGKILGPVDEDIYRSIPFFIRKQFEVIKIENHKVIKREIVVDVKEAEINKTDIDDVVVDKVSKTKKKEVGDKFNPPESIE